MNIYKFDGKLYLTAEGGDGMCLGEYRPGDDVPEVESHMYRPIPVRVYATGDFNIVVRINGDAFLVSELELERHQLLMPEGSIRSVELVDKDVDKLPTVVTPSIEENYPSYEALVKAVSFVKTSKEAIVTVRSREAYITFKTKNMAAIERCEDFEAGDRWLIPGGLYESCYEAYIAIWVEARRSFFNNQNDN